MKFKGKLCLLIALVLIFSSFPCAVFAEDEPVQEEIFQYIVSNSNYGVVEAEGVTLDENSTEIITNDKAFAGESVKIKESEREAVKLNFLPRISGEVVL